MKKNSILFSTSPDNYYIYDYNSDYISLLPKEFAEVLQIKDEDYIGDIDNYYYKKNNT